MSVMPASVPTMPMKTPADRQMPPPCALTGLILAWAVTAIVLAGCTSGDGIGTILADPGRYSAFHCKDMADRWVALNKRETLLGDLMLRASQGTGGTVIGAMAYRPEYEQILTEKRMLKRAAVEKKCDLVPQSNYQSDNIVR
jgi:hypothetical protein